MRVTLLVLLLQQFAVAFLSNFRRYSTHSRLSMVKPKSYDLVIWDCDGVLVDSEALLKQGEVEALGALGYKGITIDDCTRMFSGVSTDQAEANFLREMGSSLPRDFFANQVASSMDLFRNRLKPLMLDTVNELHKAKVPMCVASGSPRDRVLLSLAVGGIGHCFQESQVFTRELVKKGKPAPDLFLWAANAMGMKGKEARCIVIEDSSSGIEAALNANMPVIGYLGGGHAQADWYRTKIESYNIPLTYTQEEVFSKLSSL